MSTIFFQPYKKIKMPETFTSKGKKLNLWNQFLTIVFWKIFGIFVKIFAFIKLRHLLGFWKNKIRIFELGQTHYDIYITAPWTAIGPHDSRTGPPTSCKNDFLIFNYFIILSDQYLISDYDHYSHIPSTFYGLWSIKTRWSLITDHFSPFHGQLDFAHGIRVTGSTIRFGEIEAEQGQLLQFA